MFESCLSLSADHDDVASVFRSCLGISFSSRLDLYDSSTIFFSVFTLLFPCVAASLLLWTAFDRWHKISGTWYEQDKERNEESTETLAKIEEKTGERRTHDKKDAQVHVRCTSRSAGSCCSLLTDVEFSRSSSMFLCIPRTEVQRLAWMRLWCCCSLFFITSSQSLPTKTTVFLPFHYSALLRRRTRVCTLHCNPQGFTLNNEDVHSWRDMLSYDSCHWFL